MKPITRGSPKINPGQAIVPCSHSRPFVARVRWQSADYVIHRQEEASSHLEGGRNHPPPFLVSSCPPSALCSPPLPEFD